MTIDWLWLDANLIWILALSVSLTVLSFAYYRSSTGKKGGLVGWKAGWWTLVVCQVVTMIGFTLSGAAWNWIAVTGLWLAWTLLDRFVFSKGSVKEEHPPKI